MTTDLEKEFKSQRTQEIRQQGSAESLVSQSNDWLCNSTKFNYSYHFDWMDRPIIQYPQDILATQELIWRVKPDLIIETGIAHGGSLIFSASMLALLELSECVENCTPMDPSKPIRKVLGVDIDIREHNRRAIESHPMASRIQMIEGSSIDANIVNEVRNIAHEFKKVMVILDSNHTHNHVLNELQSYAPLVTLNSYCIVFDTVIEDMPSGSFPDRQWGKGNNPKTAVKSFLQNCSDFEIDSSVTDKILISVAPDGYLKRVS